MHVIVGISVCGYVLVYSLLLHVCGVRLCICVSFTHLGFSLSSLTCMVSGTSFEPLVTGFAVCLPAGLYCLCLQRTNVLFENSPRLLLSVLLIED